MAIQCSYNVVIKDGFEFEWDPSKNETNKEKHGIDFLEATSAFEDFHAKIFLDEEHSKEEERYILLGFSSNSNLLIVVYCIRGKNEKIRIISARKATKTEEREYSCKLYS